jgi:hypothetical protein
VNFPPQILPGDPDDSYPKAPAGTIFVVGPERGFAAPPSPRKVFFGRDREEVEVPIGVDDPTVSRRHGVFICYGSGSGWWLRNNGNLPIKLPGRDLLLTGHERALAPGYTPLVINPSGERSHLVKVRIIGEPGRHPRSTTKADTAPPETAYKLSEPEKLVLAALARRFLEGYVDYPQPLTWAETARVANGSPYATRTWNKDTVADTVVRVRECLHRQGVPGLTLDEVGEPVGNTLNVNLIYVLLGTATLSPQDLALLPEDD